MILIETLRRMLAGRYRIVKNDHTKGEITPRLTLGNIEIFVSKSVCIKNHDIGKFTFKKSNLDDL